MTNATLKGKPDAGNPFVASTPNYGGTGRFDEWEVASEKPRRWSLLCKKTMLSVLCLLVGGLAFADGTASNAIDLQLNVGEDALWRTATNATFEVQWRFPEGATSATLAVTGMSCAVEHAGLTSTSMVLARPVPSGREGEDVLDLTLVFDNGERRTAQVAVVSGQSCAESASAGWVRADSSQWPRAQPCNVLPIPSGAETLTVDGVAVATGLDGAAGWYGWKATEKDRPYALSLTGDGFAYDATLTWRSVRGFLLLFK